MPTIISINGLSKTYAGGFKALQDVSLNIEQGEIFALLGPNGAGKTTALRILYTVLQQDTGHARIDGFDTRETPREVQKRIGVLPDTHGLYPRLTSRENIAYFGRLHGLEGAEHLRRCRLGIAAFEPVVPRHGVHQGFGEE